MQGKPWTPPPAHAILAHVGEGHRRAVVSVDGPCGLRDFAGFTALLQDQPETAPESVVDDDLHDYNGLE
jgi:hypothetical protein